MRDASEQLFDELKDDTGQTNFDKMTDQWLASVRERVESGALPEGLVTTDATVALNLLNRNELQSRYISFRRRFGQYSLRAFTPFVGPKEERVGHPWYRTETSEEQFAEHATTRLQSSLAVSVRLHGAALVALGKATWQDIEEQGVAQVRATCREMEALTAPSGPTPTSPTPLAPPPVSAAQGQTDRAARKLKQAV